MGRPADPAEDDAVPASDTEPQGDSSTTYHVARLLLLERARRQISCTRSSTSSVQSSSSSLYSSCSVCTKTATRPDRRGPPVRAFLLVQGSDRGHGSCFSR